MSLGLGSGGSFAGQFHVEIGYEYVFFTTPGTSHELWVKMTTRTYRTFDKNVTKSLPKRKDTQHMIYHTIPHDERSPSTPLH